MNHTSIDIDWDESEGVKVNGVPLEYLLETLPALEECRKIFEETRYCRELAKPGSVGARDPIYSLWCSFGGVMDLIGVVKKEAELIMEHMKTRP